MFMRLMDFSSIALRQHLSEICTPLFIHMNRVSAPDQHLTAHQKLKLRRNVNSGVLKKQELRGFEELTESTSSSSVLSKRMAGVTMSNKKVRTDRFSNLPDDTVDLILDNLNLEEVMRTRVLSTRWNGCWKRLRKIDFSKDLVEKFIQGREHDLNRVLDSILPQLDGSVDKFHLHLPDDVPMLKSSDLTKWICLLSKNRIRDLAICCAKHLDIPSNIFTCSDLRHLKLCTCKLVHTNYFTGFPKLISLVIKNCIIPDEMLAAMISNSSTLEKLHLASQGDADPFLIKSPHLTHLSLDFGDSAREVHLEECPQLKIARFQTSLVLPKNFLWKSKLESFECLVPKLQKLIISGTALASLISGNILEKLPARFHNLKHFELTSLDMFSTDQISNMFGIMRSSPSLESLGIDLEYGEEGDIQAVENCLGLLLAEGNHTKINDVVIDYHRGNQIEVLFVRTLMAWCPQLDFLDIQTHPDIEYEDEAWLIDELRKHPRSLVMKFLSHLEDSWGEPIEPFERDEWGEPVGPFEPVDRDDLPI